MSPRPVVARDRSQRSNTTDSNSVFDRSTSCIWQSLNSTRSPRKPELRSPRRRAAAASVSRHRHRRRRGTADRDAEGHAGRAFDADFAARTAPGARIVHGGLTTGLFNALVAEVLPGPGSVFLHQEWDYPAPVYIGDTVTAEAEVVAARADKPITTLRCVARRADGTEVLTGTCVVYTMIPRAPG
ncbi:MAG: MaoC/PaaZ C-terminal domain-containing protein [Candidatus Limnocylindrales bacterium]